MIAYLIKSGLCLAILLVIYLVLLERHKMHRFNRIFLLAALVVGLTVPMFPVDVVRNKLITETPTEIVSSVALTSTEWLQSVAEYPSNRNKVLKPNSTQIRELNSSEIAYTRNFSFHFLKGFSLIAYTLICSFLFVRMGFALYSFYEKEKKNRSLSYKSARLVLIGEPIAPHTFLDTIFVNKDQYHSGEIADQIFEHELTHATQKHSLDVFFVELLRIIFWFNPIFYFYKRAIQINHEFLADQSVLDKTNDPVSYKKLLIESVLPSYKTNLSSSFNYALTKKRFIMMVKKSTTQSMLSRKVVLIPIIASLALVFGTKISQDRLTYEINGVKFTEPYNSAWFNSNSIILSKNEEMNKSLYDHKWKYYDEEGNPFTGEWIIYDKDDDEKIDTRSEIENGKLLSKTRYYNLEGLEGRLSIVRETYQGDTVSTTMFSSENELWGITTIAYKNNNFNIIRIQSFNEEKETWGVIDLTSIAIKDNPNDSLNLITEFNSLGNIESQKLFEGNKEIPLTQKAKDVGVRNAKNRYKNTLLEYQRVLPKGDINQIALAFEELKRERSTWFAFRKKYGISGELPPLPSLPTELLKKKL